MSHNIIIRSRAAYTSEGVENGADSAELSWSPTDDMTLNEQARQFKQKLKVYYEAIGREPPHDPNDHD